LILAYEDRARSTESLGKRQQRSYFLTFSLSCVVCLSLVAPLISRDFKLAKALAANRIPAISTALMTFPKDADQIALVAEAYEKLGRDKEALELAKSAISENPNSPRSWRIIFESQEANQVDKDLAKIALRRLDPFFVVR
jgi:tetratricopeptide (TPR) repeat protein